VYKPTIWALKDTLLERYVLSKDEVFALLEDMPPPPAVTEPQLKVA
jgi:cell division protease FtsH